MKISSLRTTLVGVATFVIVVASQVIGLVDNDPTTTFELDVILAALGTMFAAFVARDNQTTDEQAGAK
jgi:hypothetical protein